MLAADQLELGFLQSPSAAIVTQAKVEEEPEKNEVYEWLIKHPPIDDTVLPEHELMLRQGFSDPIVTRQIRESELVGHPDNFVERQKLLHGGVDEKVANRYAEVYAKVILFEELCRIKHWRDDFGYDEPAFENLKCFAVEYTNSSDELYKLERARDEELFNTESFKFLKTLFSRPEATEEERAVLNAIENNQGVFNFLISRNPKFSDFSSEYAVLEKTFSLNGRLDKAGEDKLGRAKSLALADRIMDSIYIDREYLKELITTNKTELVLTDQFRERLKASYKNAEDAIKKDSPENKEPAEFNRDGSRKLEDFGEDLNNTRKGRGAGKPKEKSSPINFVNLTDWQIENYLSLQPLEKIWPMQSIHDLYKVNREGAAFLYLLRSEIGKKPPIHSWKYHRYVEKAVNAIRIHQQLLTHDVDDEVSRHVFDYAYGAARDYKVFSLVDPKYWPNIDRFTVRSAVEFCDDNKCRLSDGTDVNSYAYAVVVPCKYQTQKAYLHFVKEDGQIASESRVAIVSNDLDDIRAKLNSYMEVFLASKTKEDVGAKTKPQAPVNLFGRYQRGQYEVYGKVGTIELQLTDRLTFENDKAFTQYVKDHQQELSAKYHELRSEYSKTEKDWRGNSPIRDRIGPDWRKGKDATPELFLSTFGFRGVEFGNWVHQGKKGRERQWMLNNAYDSLCDLATILNIPTKAVALDGSLGLCFGSRGFGSASAHYEPENRIINLTKTKGYSSLAHEWFHALDHYMARNLYEHKLKGKYFMSDRAEPVNYGLTGEAAERIRKEIGQEFKHVNIDTLDAESVIRRVDSQLKEGTEFKQLLDGSLRELSFGIVCTPLDNTGYRTLVRKEVRLTKDDISQKELTPARYEFTEEAKERFIQYINETGVKVSNPESPIQLMLSEVVRGSNFNDLLAGRIDKISINSDDFYFFTKDGKKLQFELKKEDFLPVMVRPEVFYAWGDTIEAIRGSSMHQRMTKKNAYWQSKIEEAARSFEAFVEVRCKELGIQNDFLTRNVHLDKELDKESFYPYLNGKDVNTVKEKFEKLFKEIKTRDTAKGVELFSKIKGEKSGATVSEIQDSLNKYFGKKAIDGLIDAGSLGIFRSTKEAERFHLTNALEGKKNLNSDLPEGFVAQVYLKGMKDFPSGPVVFIEGCIEDKKLISMSRSSLSAILNSSICVFRVDTRRKEGKNYMFYSRRFGHMLVTTFNRDKNRFEIRGDVLTPDHPELLYGYDFVRLSASFQLSEAMDNFHGDLDPELAHGFSVGTVVNELTSGVDSNNHPGARFEAPYIVVDYREEIKRALDEDKEKQTTSDGLVQGFYSPDFGKAFLITENMTPQTAPAVFLHEIGVHMAHDSVLANKMEPLIRAAPDIYELGIKANDPVALAVYKRLNDSGINKQHSAYKEEVCGYLVEESAKRDAKLPAVKRWAVQVLSATKVWLYEHNFNVGMLTARDLATIAKSNVKTMAFLDRETEKLTDELKSLSLSEKGKKVLNEHIKALRGNYNKIQDAKPEIKRLYTEFCELEKAGRPLPPAPTPRNKDVNNPLKTKKAMSR